jgi:hypothetical protein
MVSYGTNSISKEWDNSDKEFPHLYGSVKHMLQISLLHTYSAVFREEVYRYEPPLLPENLKYILNIIL